jgi:hypothetical protein
MFSSTSFKSASFHPTSWAGLSTGPTPPPVSNGGGGVGGYQRRPTSKKPRKPKQRHIGIGHALLPTIPATGTGRLVPVVHGHGVAEITINSHGIGAHPRILSGNGRASVSITSSHVSTQDDSVELLLLLASAVW